MVNPMFLSKRPLLSLLMASTSQVKEVNLILLTCEQPLEENVFSADLGKSPNLPEQFFQALIHFDEHIR